MPPLLRVYGGCMPEQDAVMLGEQVEALAASGNAAMATQAALEDRIAEVR